MRRHQPTTSAAGSRISSDDGAIVFVVSAGAGIAYVDRIEPLKGIGRLSHLVRFEDMTSFERAYEADPMRHTYPLVYWRLRQAVEGILKR